MPTNEDRREVAARLRSIDSSKWCCYSHEFDERMIAELMTACGCDSGQDWQDMCIEDRLADLIEPEPERTCHKELMTTEDYAGTEVYCFGCSECGEFLSYPDCYGLYDGPNYCPNCGAKVVE